VLPEGTYAALDHHTPWTHPPHCPPLTLAAQAGTEGAPPQRGNEGAMIRYAFNPNPSRSRSSLLSGSSPLSSFTRSSR
jgi:hypothetical protein